MIFWGGSHFSSHLSSPFSVYTNTPPAAIEKEPSANNVPPTCIVFWGQTNKCDLASPPGRLNPLPRIQTPGTHLEHKIFHTNPPPTVISFFPCQETPGLRKVPTHIDEFGSQGSTPAPEVSSELLQANPILMPLPGGYAALTDTIDSGGQHRAAEEGFDSGVRGVGWLGG